jgi:hypothetical protein
MARPSKKPRGGSNLRAYEQRLAKLESVLNKLVKLHDSSALDGSMHPLDYIIESRKAWAAARVLIRHPTPYPDV